MFGGALPNYTPFTSPPDLPKGCVPFSLPQVEFYVSRDFPKFDSVVFFYHARRKITKFSFEMCSNKIEAGAASTRFFCRRRVLHLFSTECKNTRLRDFF
jgi:hypothetical protein